MDTKFCRDCGYHRPVADFSVNKRSRDGLAFYCRQHLAERSLKSREARRVKPRTHRFAPQGTVVPEGHKWCPDCGSVKRLDAFPRTRASSSGRATYCLPCHNERGKRSREAVGGSRTYHLTRRYGITAEEADAMSAQQDGRCAICRTAPAAHVDHDHETGRVRELLCFGCNGGLGQFKDAPDVLRRAATYVEEHALRGAGEPTEATSGPASGSTAELVHRRVLWLLDEFRAAVDRPPAASGPPEWLVPRR
ncbi:endonuclease [Modestobacter sp. I12A-02628]|uniref:Endonuclease n=1 Tax=Goekera deserti TaxID=2497753 RepID=A0A7K3WE58_9ACTN|nr:endonuclease VII domain-containing protein [Goekera deserti]MPQ99636.1 endonuclease [Goekera deserti]NDI46354.1 endonuclease [Goekera deserti]NEL54714.1 endonuclease [Goekera deserti]